MKVRILIEGVYANPDHSVSHRNPGDLHFCREWYAQSIIESGYAEPITDAADLGTQTDSEDPVLEDQDHPAIASFTNLPGITEALNDQLHEAGIRTTEALLSNLIGGQVVAILGPRRTARLKKHFGLIE